MTGLADMIERVAEREELDRLRAENARLKRRVEALEQDGRHRQRWDAMQMQMNVVPLYTQEQLRPMTCAELAMPNPPHQPRPMQWCWHEEAKPAPLSWLFGGITGARWP